MVKLTTKKVLSETEFQLISIRDEVIKAVEESGIQNGFVLVMSAHTTAGVMVNEDLTCLHTDIEATLDKMAPVVADYAHSPLSAKLWSNWWKCAWSSETDAYGI